ncbi:MAG: HAD-IA family hydrolase [Acidobacteria bacterium]|nr:HAD-IA family hydrolase [Acidobacteriota bacterium]
MIDRAVLQRLRSSRLLIFDLDGTLIDSRHDLSASVNRTLEGLGHPALPAGEITSFIGDGVVLLLTRALKQATRSEIVNETLLERALVDFNNIYGDHLLDHTRPMPGAEELLRTTRRIRKAVVTNKPHRFSVQILERLGLMGAIDFVAGGDTFAERKPDPAPLLKVAERLGVEPARATMIGDSAQDILAGRSAGFLSVGVASGFQGRAELAASGAEVIIEDLIELTRSLA